MADPNDKRTAARIDKLVSDVLAGRHLKATPSDAADRGAIQVAGRLAGVREGYPRMSPAFRRRMARVLEDGQAPQWLNRRAALVAGLGLAAGAVGGAAVSPLAGRLAGLTPGPRLAPRETPYAPAPSSRGWIEPRPEVARWWDTGLQLTDMAEGVPHRVTAGSVGAFIVRQGMQVIGMSSYCTHFPCELVWQTDKQLLNCPCHNLTFDVDGQSMHQGIALPALPYVRVRVRTDGRVEVLGT